MHVPGATESATVRNDFLCDLCSSALQEDRKFRVLGGKNAFTFCNYNFKNSVCYFDVEIKLNIYSNNVCFCSSPSDKQIVEIITAQALHAFQGYSNNQPFRFQSLTIFLRGKFCLN